MTATLKHAISRLENARCHIAAFKDIERALGQGPGNLTKVSGNVNTGETKVEPALAPVPDKARHRFSDAIANLRSVLDYLVYELALLDSGSQKEQTQFPICDKPEAFQLQCKKGRLEGLNDAHVARIEAMQPFKGTKWTGTLRDLSNPDKHKALTSTQRQTKVEAGPATDVINAQGQPARNIRISIDTKIVFADGTNAVDTLEEISKEVGSLLASFEPDFAAKPQNLG